MTPTHPSGSGFLSLWHYHPLRVHIATVFTAVIFAACGLIAWSNPIQGKAIVLGAAEDLIDRIDNEAGTALKNLFAPVESLVALTAVAPVSGAASLRERLRSLPAAAELLRHNPQLASFYVGYDNGDFFLVRPLPDDGATKEFGAPPGSAYLVQSIEKGPSRPFAGTCMCSSANVDFAPPKTTKKSRKV